MIPELHPLVIHFPIALFSTAILFDVIFILSNKPTNMIVGWWVMLLALISSAAAIATGIIDDTLIGHLGSVFPIWENHGWVQILSSMVFLVLFIYRTRYPYFYETPKLQWFYLISSGIGVSLLFYGGHLGAKLAGRI